MWAFRALCDEFYVASRLFFKLELTPSREALLHFCEQLRKTYPRMSRLRRREDAGIILDEPPDENESRRFFRLDSRSLRLGQFNPPDPASLQTYGTEILKHAPYHLSLSDLDYEAIELAFGFDLEYAGNHDELVCEALYGDHPLLKTLAGGDQQIIDCQPCLGVALTDDCATQAYVEIRGRTAMSEIRAGEYEAQLLSIYLTLRRDFRYSDVGDVAGVYRQLLETGEDLAAGRVIPFIVRPLREAIASRR